MLPLFPHHATDNSIRQCQLRIYHVQVMALGADNSERQVQEARPCSTNTCSQGPLIWAELSKEPDMEPSGKGEVSSGEFRSALVE